MLKIAPLILAALALALPGSAVASTPHSHHHKAHHAKAHRAQVAGCEGPQDPVTWAEWRVDMAAAGFTPDETAELEVCGEG